MMYGYNTWGMMGAMSFFGQIALIVIIADLVLVGIWLWKKINKEK